MRFSSSRLAISVAVAVIIVVGSVGGIVLARSHGSSGPTATGGSPSPVGASPTPTQPATSSSSPTASTPQGPLVTDARGVYIHYYLFWSAQHWRDRLGPNYPTNASPLPLPGAMDGTGCNPSVKFSGAQIVDVPSEGLYDQDQGAGFDTHIAAAVNAGISGFLVSWMGTGTPGQAPEQSGYNQRLDLLVQRVDAYNAAHQSHFRLGLAFASFGDYSRPADQIINDLDYFRSRYASDPAFADAYSSKPLVMWLDSRKYVVDTVRQVSAAEQPHLYLVGDETAASWSRDAGYLDASSYYWSSENPATNSRAQREVDALGSEVRGAGKRWFAPFIAGYNRQLSGGSCVPRNGLSTLRSIWSTNLTSRPDGWFGISWNEFVENTYLQPSVAYGTTYLDEVARLVKAWRAGA
jgi:hypothetical protein